ncbi:MAG TPA: 30S ribosomal protein S18 [Acidimicrobiales bacterium]|nr:30S ribosomal protein S18 [Acidimicrobiales bacterium]
MVSSTERSTRRHAKSPARRLTQTSCALCQDKVEWVDYKNVNLLRRYMSDGGKIRARAATGNCVRHQGEVSVAIKTARELVLLPRGDTKPTTTEPLEMTGATRGGRS